MTAAGAGMAPSGRPASTVHARTESRITEQPELARPVVTDDLPRLVAVVAAITVGALALVVLVGWMVDVAPLKSVLPGLASMKANTALCLLLVAGGLGLTTGGGGSMAARTARVALPLLASIVGALTQI